MSPSFARCSSACAPVFCAAPNLAAAWRPAAHSAHAETLAPEKSAMPRPTSESACDVCSDSSGQLMSCGGCGVQVHAVCYGVKRRPPAKSVWKCGACLADDEDALTCVLCPQYGGALKPCQKKRETSRRRDTEQPRGWAHVFCAKWLPPAGFGDEAALEPITGCDKVLAERGGQRCDICRKSVGGVRECAHGSCKKVAHPRCAREAGLKFNAETRGIYCAAHSRAPSNAVGEAGADVKDDSRGAAGKRKAEGGSAATATAGNASSTASSASSSQPQVALCGTFGCTLPERHSGLHSIPEIRGKRARISYENEQGRRGRAPAASDPVENDSSQSRGDAPRAGAQQAAPVAPQAARAPTSRMSDADPAVQCDGSEEDEGQEQEQEQEAEDSEDDDGGDDHAGGKPNRASLRSLADSSPAAARAQRGTAPDEPPAPSTNDGLRGSLLGELALVLARDSSQLLQAEDAILHGHAMGPRDVCPAPSLRTALERLCAGGYANVNQLAGDLRALGDAARRRVQQRAAVAQRGEGGLSDEATTSLGTLEVCQPCPLDAAGNGDGGVVASTDGTSSGAGGQSAELAMLLRACQDAVSSVGARFVVGSLVGPRLPRPPALQALPPRMQIDAAHIEAPPAASKPPAGRGWWQAAKDGEVVLPPMEERSIPSSLERVHGNVNQRLGPSSEPTINLRPAWAPPLPSSAANGTALANGTLPPPEELGRLLLWATQHWPAFNPVLQPCLCLVDGRTCCVLLGWTEIGAGGLKANQEGTGGGGGSASDGGRATARYAIVAGYFCVRPVQVVEARVEIGMSVLEGGNPGAAGEGTRRVVWHDGESSSERAARLIRREVGDPHASIGQVVSESPQVLESRVRSLGAPAVWWSLLESVSSADPAMDDVSPRLEEAARCELLRDVAAWGFGWARASPCSPPWGEADAAMLDRHVRPAAAALRPALLALLAPVMGRSLAYLRQRWHMAAVQPFQRALDQPCATVVAARTDTKPDDALARLGVLNTATTACVWQLAERLGGATPPELWSLMRPEDALDEGAMPAEVRAHMRHVEKGIYKLEQRLLAPRPLAGEERAVEVRDEAQMVTRPPKTDENAEAAMEVDGDEGTAGAPPVGTGAEAGEAVAGVAPVQAPVPARSSDGHSGLDGKVDEWPPCATDEEGLDGRQYVFRIDDITYEREGGHNPNQHRIPICAVNEVDDEAFPSIDYLHACVAGEGVCLETPAEFLVGCGCEEGPPVADKGAAIKARKPAWCSLDGGCSCCHEQVVQSGGVVYDGNGRLRKSYIFGNPIYECNAACACGEACGNRVVQRGISKRIQVFKTRHKGWAVRALEYIPQGSFVVEYIGEVITTDEAERRGVEYDKGGFSTLFDLDAVGDAACEYTIDATYRCGVARFLNHSCAPNLRQASVWVDTLSLALPRIAFFATRDIQPLEELTFDYKYEANAEATMRCHCGAPSCREWLY